MGQQEYEAFKAKLREWMNTHPDEYAAFEEAMNARDYAGCQSVIFQAMSLIPRYRRLMSDKANEGLFEHVDEIEQAARQQINTAFHHSLTLIRAKKAAFAAFNCVLRHFIPFWYMLSSETE